MDQPEKSLGCITWPNPEIRRSGRTGGPERFALGVHVRVAEDQPVVARRVRRQLGHQLPDEDGIDPGLEALQPGLVLRERRPAERGAQPVDDVEGRAVVPALEVAVADDVIPRLILPLTWGSTTVSWTGRMQPASST